MLNWLIKTFFTWLYHFKPPSMVKYWLRSDGALARVKKNPKGHYEMQVQGESESMPGFPRGPVLFSSVGKAKHEVKTRFFNKLHEKYQELMNEVIEEMGPDMGKLVGEMTIDMIEPDKMVPAVKELWDTFERLENEEVTEDMKGRIKLFKKVLCFILDSDDAYRFRAQEFLWLLNQKKVRLSKQDLYYAQGKYWKPLRYIKLFGKIFDRYEY